MNTRVTRLELVLSACAVLGVTAWISSCGQTSGSSQTGSGGAPARATIRCAV